MVRLRPTFYSSHIYFGACVRLKSNTWQNEIGPQAAKFKERPIMCTYEPKP